MRAHDEPALPPDYEREISTAVDEHEAGHFEAARLHFMRAHELFPSARTLRGLGKVEFELHDYVAAVHYLEDALASQVRPLPVELRDEVSQLLARALASTATIVLTLKPESTQLSLDGAVVSLGPSGELVLSEGEHVLEARASGYLSERRQLSLHAGERTALQLALAAPSVLQPHVQPNVQRDVPRPVYRQWWFWTLSGVAVAGVTATAVLLATRDRHSGDHLDWTQQQP